MQTDTCVISGRERVSRLYGFLMCVVSIVYRFPCGCLHQATSDSGTRKS